MSGAAGKLWGRAAVWAEICKRKRFTLRELECALPHVGRNTIEEYVRSLCKGGFVRIVGNAESSFPQKRKAYLYELARDVGVEAPRLHRDGSIIPPSGQQRMWKVMQVLPEFDAATLAGAASLPGAPVSVLSAKEYAQTLTRAGYLVSVGPGRWKLVNNTGGQAPQMQRAKTIFDPNLQQVVWIEGAL